MVMHVSLNLHRGPGFCINAGFNEPFNLWKDQEAQDAFYFHWGMWAERYKNISSEKLSFDLLNEPCYKEDMNDQFSKSTAVPGETYRKVAIGASKAIWAANPDRLIVADGNSGGSNVTPELIDLNIGSELQGILSALYFALPGTMGMERSIKGTESLYGRVQWMENHSAGHSLKSSTNHGLSL